MLESAIKSDRKFPDAKSAKLTLFAYICKLSVSGETIHVVHQKEVLTNMPAPRGVRYISFFDHLGNYLTKYRYSGDSEPLWCEGNKLYLFGNYEGPLSSKCGNECNAMQVDLKGKAMLLHEKKYGSSGGSLDM